MQQMQEMLWCRSCRSETLHIQKPPNHLLHFLLTLATLGVWVIPWIYLSFKQDRPRCQDCGAFFSAQLKAEEFDERD
jgi:hypothetical protein